MAGKYLLTIQQFRHRVSRLSNGSGSVVAQIPSTIVETTDGGTTYAGVYVQGWQASLRVLHQTLNDRVRPGKDIPRRIVYFRNAANPVIRNAQHKARQGFTVALNTVVGQSATPHGTM